MTTLMLTGEAQELTKDTTKTQVTNPELDLARRLDKELASKDLIPKTKHEKQSDTKSAIDRIFVYKQRKWLVQRGKGEVLEFTDEELQQLRDCFNSLDDDGGGSIGIEELEEPLVGLGFAQNKDEVY